jgi:tetratricopeptide (TPR) repeat protein
MNANVTSKTIRRLRAAEGYLELNMPKNALDELESIEEPGPLEAVVEFLKGEALKGQQRYEEAVEPLKRAAELVPAPHNQKAWLSLSECFRQGGKEELAEMVEIMARTQTAAIGQIPINLQLSITIHQHPGQDVEIDLSDETPMDDEPDFYDEGDPEFN